MPENVTERHWKNDEYEPLENVIDLIWKIGPPVVLVFGIFGNSMVILTMRRLPASSLSILFQVLACSDQLLLILHCLSEWLSYAFDVPHMSSQGSWPCKMYTLVTYTVAILSPWILVALTMQRAASVLWPHRVNAVWTKAKSRAVAGVLIVVITLIHCHCLYGYDFDPERCSSETKCCATGSSSYRWFFNMVWSWLDLIEFSFLPFVMLVISISVLVWKLAGSFSAGRHLSVQQTTQDSRQQKVSSLTVTLVTVSAVFFLLTTPMTINTVASPYVDQDNPNYKNFAVFGALSYMMWYSNSAVNFYLYCLSGRKFRTAFCATVMETFRLFHQTQKPSHGVHSTTR